MIREVYQEYKSFFYYWQGELQEGKNKGAGCFPVMASGV
jgi:hypothetical protein